MTATLDRPATAAAELPRTRPSRLIPVTAALVLALLVLGVLSAGTGQLGVPPEQVLGSVLHRIGLDWLPLPSHPNGDAALWSIRFPRVAMAMLVGAALATAGAVMQGVFGNPLADPGVVGVSSGAALAACAGIVWGLSFAGAYTTAVLAFGGGLAATFLVYLLARSGGRTEVVTLVLTGVAVNAVGGAGIAFLTFLGDTQSREQIVFWQLGSLNGTRWAYVGVVAPLVLAGVLAAVLLARRLDLLALGERAARHVGVDVERLRIVSIVVVALLTAAAVAFCGIIAFVGLVVPHLIRMLLGPGHRVLVPLSALGGAVLLTGADLVARTAVAYADLPIGMLTALVGGPFFFWLIRRTRRTAGGWA
ncbi:FecCD family ABC transporter permease [Cellulomonas denverensis]|uniref:Iron ABC transporter permease n=1 Tax=Cellulomonas denverensis TaxID=264297 RepID=A0A7X6KVT8_9CELL|nr:iron ABC transporter permease [Cellulomonas denverensis]NKY23058.1 iron ABC transporter permease [Cellulomonas denverensis]GIG23861.1 ABC transporter permease [Cellulomonas denverensis]